VFGSPFGAQASSRDCSGVCRTGAAATTPALLADLRGFAGSADPQGDLVSFVATFRGPRIATEQRFEELLWQQLQLLNDLDPEPWNPSVSRDPADSHFGFSAAGTAFFVVGLHPSASRLARGAPMPMLVFNLHEQFQRLRAGGGYDRMRETIRRRDRNFQGTNNPMVADHGEISEARQYSGRAVEVGWRTVRGDRDGRISMTRLQPQTGTGFLLEAGHRLTVIDPMGGQVSDLYCLNAADNAEALSSGRSIDYANRLLISEGDALYSNRSNVMATVEEDSCGRNDFLLTPCSQQTFDLLYPDLGGADHPNCLANLGDGLRQFGVGVDTIGTTFNIFMNVWWEPNGELHIDPPSSRPGDRLVLRAEMDLHVGLTACSAEKSNGGTCKPIDFYLQS